MVSIRDIKEENRRHSFTCISCQRKLIPRAIKPNAKKTAHFYHADKGIGANECGGEGYLHWISKELLAEALLDDEVVVLCEIKSVETAHASLEEFLAESENVF